MQIGIDSFAAAYNEEKFIERTMRSVVAQSLRPVKWVIVSDGSTDRTDEMVRSYAAQHEFISLHRITEKHARNFGAQVHAINTGYEKLKGLDFDFFGNVDADVALPPNYYASLAQKFDDVGGCVWSEIENAPQPSRPIIVERHIVSSKLK